MSAPEQHRTASSGVRPSLVVACASERDIAREIGHAAATGMRLVPRGGGHCFAGRSTTDGIVLDLAAMDQVRVDPSGTATIGAGCRLRRVYGALHAVGRTLSAGCGETVGIAGLTLGGGIGLLGRRHGLTCDRLIGARVVLANGDIVDCDEHREPDLFWALRGAGGGQFGVVGTFRFATVPEPMVSRVEVVIPGNVDLGALVTDWQEHAPDAPDGLTVDLVVEQEPGVPGVQIRAVGVSSLPASVTNAWLRELLGRAGSARLRVEDPVPYSTVKETHADERRSLPQRPVRLRSEFFEHTIEEPILERILSLLADADRSRPRRLSYTAMGGAYNRVASGETAFAHRGTRFLLEHVGDPGDPWIDDSWNAAHEAGSGRVYPNFPDLLLEDPLAAYHGANADRLAGIKLRYDPHRFFDFPQAIQPAGSDPHTGTRFEDEHAETPV